MWIGYAWMSTTEQNLDLQRGVLSLERARRSSRTLGASVDVTDARNACLMNVGQEGVDRAGFHAAGAGGGEQLAGKGRRQSAVEDVPVRPLETFMARGRATKYNVVRAARAARIGLTAGARSVFRMRRRTDRRGRCACSFGKSGRPLRGSPGGGRIRGRRNGRC
jgi:hypothetical protein